METTKGIIFLHIPYNPRREDVPVPVFTKTLFPARVWFVRTTNKAQVQSFGGGIVIYLFHECFTHGQLYVAISRITHPSNHYLHTEQPHQGSTKVVYPFLLLIDRSSKLRVLIGKKIILWVHFFFSTILLKNVLCVQLS